VFDGPNGKETLADLFGGKSQLIVYHFMLGPGWEEGCPSCSLLADHFDGAVIHLAQRDVAFVVVSRAPLEQIEKFKRRMGWHFKWVSSFGNDFNYDYHVSATPEEKAGQGDVQLRSDRISERRAPRRQRVLQERRRRGVSHLFELRARPRYSDRRLQFPRPRAQGPRRGRPAYGMAWVRHHDRYDGAVVDPNASYRRAEEIGIVLRLMQ
jgi:predicted dithiol-disulfide oxidoreductase (DUF899 family)